MPLRMSVLSSVFVAMAVIAAVSAPAGGATANDDCGGWHVRTVASGLGSLENVLAEDSGALLVSDTIGGRLLRVAPTGASTTVAEGLPGLGGLAWHDGTVYATTGNNAVGGVLGSPDGRIVRIDPTTGRSDTWATGLVMPNGLAVLANGDAITTRDITGVGTDSTVSYVTATDPTHPDLHWADLVSSNGANLDPSGEWVYLTSTLSPRAEVWRVNVSDPAIRSKVADLGTGLTTILDDLAVSTDGTLFVPAAVPAAIYRVDPVTGSTCTVATGLIGPTAVESGRGPDAGGRLYVTSLLGTLYELSPPMP